MAKATGQISSLWNFTLPRAIPFANRSRQMECLHHAYLCYHEGDDLCMWYMYHGFGWDFFKIVCIIYNLCHFLSTLVQLVYNTIASLQYISMALKDKIWLNKAYVPQLFFNQLHVPNLWKLFHKYCLYIFLFFHAH